MDSEDIIYPVSPVNSADASADASANASANAGLADAEDELIVNALNTIASCIFYNPNFSPKIRIKNKLIETLDKLESAENALESTKKALKNREQEIKHRNQEIKDFQDEIKSLKRKNKQLEDDCESINIKYKIFKGMIERLRHKNTDIKYNPIDKYIKKIFCYRGHCCTFDKCTFAHSINELVICPYGDYCNNKAFCGFMLHNEQDRASLFIEISLNCKLECLCEEFHKTNNCQFGILCRKIHWCVNSR